MLQLTGIMCVVLVSMTIAATTRISPVVLGVAAVAISAVVATGLVITRSDRR